MEEKQENLLQNTMQEKAKYYGNRIWRDMSSLGKWLILAVVTGCIVGAASSLFSYVLKTVTNVREEHLWIFYLLPVKKEVKVVVSGIYITAIKSARGGLEKPQPKKGFFKRLFNK